MLPGMRQQAARSEFLGEGFQIRATDCRAEKDMQAGRIDDMLDFLAESIGNAIKADFKGLDNVLLTGKDLPPLLAFLTALLPAFLPAFLP